MTSKTLLDLGYKQGKWFKEAIEYINYNNLVGNNMIDYLDSVKPIETIHIQPFSEPLNYIKNITSETDDERQNIIDVCNTMDVLMKTPTVVNGAIMPDACPTGEVGQIPVGGIVVTKGTIHPSMHSADVCCSVMMTNFGDVCPKIVLDAAHSITHFGGGGRNRNDEFRLPQELTDRIKSNEYLKDNLSIAISHLGTQGDGNHFLYVGKLKSTNETVMVTHHGSRGFGTSLYKTGMKVAEKFRQQLSPNTLQRNAWIPYNTIEGKIYWDALQIVRDWTKLNHQVLHNKTSELLNITPSYSFWNEHNFVFKDENDLFYHAKGATSLDDKFVPDSYNGLRLIPLNMSENILIVKGETTENNLGFAPHGAGRNMSRSQHIRNKGLSETNTINDIFELETKGLDIRFFSGNVDISELPSAYKNAENVKSQMNAFGLGEVIDEVIPYGCIMAGDWQKNVSWKQLRKNKIRK